MGEGWIAVNRYCISRRDYSITKAHVNGEARYMIFHNTELLPVTYERANLAKCAVDALEKRAAAKA